MRKEIITNNDPKSPISEVFRSLRTNMQYMGSKKKLTILVTSTMQGEGKSFITTNLAVTFAQAGKKTIIVDTDMRRPRQHKIFETDATPGLSNYLSGVNFTVNDHELLTDECIFKTDIENLSIFPAGNVPPNPSELLLSGKLKELISDLEEKFDVIIFDGAPCLLVTDATIVARRVNYTIIVASQNETKMEDLKEAQRRIKHVGGHVAGVVLNRVKMSKKQYGNKYYYGARESHYGHKHSRGIFDSKIENFIKNNKLEKEIKNDDEEEFDNDEFEVKKLTDIKKDYEEYDKNSEFEKEIKEENKKEVEKVEKIEKTEEKNEDEIKYRIEEKENSSVKEIVMNKEDYDKISASKEKISDIIKQINKLNED